MLLIIFAILVLFGPRKIPEVAQMVGKGMRKVRDAQDEFTQHLRDISTDMEKSADIKDSIQALDMAVEQHSTVATPMVEDSAISPPPPTYSPMNEEGNGHTEQNGTPSATETSIDTPAPTVSIKPAEGSVSR